MHLFQNICDTSRKVWVCLVLFCLCFLFSSFLSRPLPSFYYSINLVYTPAIQIVEFSSHWIAEEIKWNLEFCPFSADRKPTTTSAPWRQLWGLARFKKIAGLEFGACAMKDLVGSVSTPTGTLRAQRQGSRRELSWLYKARGGYLHHAA